MRELFGFNQATKIIATVFAVSIGALLVALVFGTMMYKQTSPELLSNIRTINDFTYELENDEAVAVKLPHNFENLPPRTAITLYTDVTAETWESLYIKTIYAPLRLYADDKLIYECGQEGSYPTFLLDPPTIVATVPLPDVSGVQKLRFQYLSPAQRSTFTVPIVQAGNDVALIAQLAEKNAFSLLFSLILIFMGVTMILISLLIIRTTKGGLTFLWLGLFALTTGAWGFGETNLTAFLVPYPSLLYVMAFVGLFSFGIPLVQFGILVLNPHKHQRILLTTMQFVSCTALLVALALQLTGQVGFSRSMYVFHILELLAVGVLAVCIVWEYVAYKSEAAKQFAVPMLVLFLFTILEVVNYQFRFTNVLSLFFQTGMLFFVFSLGVMAGNFTRDALRVQSEKTRLELEVASTIRLMDIQKERYVLLMANAEAVRTQRHDLRHQLAVVKSYSSTKDTEKLNEYLDELIAKIPSDKEMVLCENFAVNAVAAHYISIAETEGIDVSAKLVIPTTNGQVNDSDLCIIIGNFLENAIEACRRTSDGERFIKLKSSVKSDYLIIVMDNCFNGSYKLEGNTYYSQKHDGVGIGLSSVKSVAEKYGGSVQFEPDGNVFLSSAMVRIKGVEEINDCNI